MKIKKKLKIAFMVLVLSPLLLMLLLGIGYGNVRARMMEQTYGVPFSMDFLVTSLQTISESTEDICEEIRKQAERDPQKCRDTVYLKQLNEQLMKKQSYLLVYEDDQVYFKGFSSVKKDLLDALIEDQDKERTSYSYYLGNSGQQMIRRIDVPLSTQKVMHFYIVTSAQFMMKRVKVFLWQMAIGIVCILLITAFGMTFWISQSMADPISKLSEATRRIAAGDLDFTLEVKGNDEVSSLFRDFEQMRCTLKESEEQKRKYDQQSRELIRNISHDLKTPITTIKGYVEGIMDGVADTPEKMERYIRTIYNKSMDMDRLVNELTFYSQINTDRIPYHFSRLKTVDYFGDCAEELCMDLEEYGISFVYENKTEPDTRIIGDPEQLKRVIDNITGNSVKYMDKPDGRLELRILDVGDFVQVEIEDNGKGIAPEDLPNVFNRFYRSDTARNTEKGGSGIGLSIVKKIVEDHGGRIWVTSRLGQGTTMHFVLRKYLDPMTEAGQGENGKSGKKQKNQNGGWI